MQRGNGDSHVVACREGKMADAALRGADDDPPEWRQSEAIGDLQPCPERGLRPVSPHRKRSSGRAGVRSLTVHWRARRRGQRGSGAAAIWRVP